MGNELDFDPPLLAPVPAGIESLTVVPDILDEQLGVQDQVLGVGTFTWMLLQREGAAGHHPSQIPTGSGAGAMAAQGLHAQ
jgi:hypothetical protein